VRCLRSSASFSFTRWAAFPWWAAWAVPVAVAAGVRRSSRFIVLGLVLTIAMVSSPAPASEALASTPEPPYYAVIFTSLRRGGPDADAAYARTAAEMDRLAREQPGFLDIESVRDSAGVGITVSYWASLEAIAAWREHGEHRMAQRAGRTEWYGACAVRVCRVERASMFEAREAPQQ
jgi:heme-degrading monooxygenase HmoA